LLVVLSFVVCKLEIWGVLWEPALDHWYHKLGPLDSILVLYLKSWLSSQFICKGIHRRKSTWGQNDRPCLLFDELLKDVAWI
jgi:hypothetical protein